MSVTGIGRAGGAGPIDGAGGAGPSPSASGTGEVSAAVVRGTSPRDPLAAARAAGGGKVGIAMSGFDDVAAAINAGAGPDLRLTVAEAEREIAKLESAGRGAEAQAARAIVHELPAARRPDGSIDLGKARRLLEASYIDGTGTGTPLERCLLDVGRMAALPPRGGRIPRAIAADGAEHVAGLIRAAGGRDGKCSKREMLALVAALEKEGRGAEGLAVFQLHTLGEARDGRLGGVTARDLDHAVTTVRQAVAAADTNQNGLSAAEVARLSPEARSSLEVGRRIEAGFLRRSGRLDQDSPIAFPFTEDAPLPPGFAPSRVVKDGSFRVHAGKTELTGIRGRDAIETALLEAAFGHVWERTGQHRADPPGSPAPVARNGELRLGEWRDPASGEVLKVAHWKDIDDDSRVSYFRRAPGLPPRFELAHDVYLN